MVELQKVKELWIVAT
ncbi:hypothetical protein CGLO_14316 [Colletotrichum gloeosporioides Cg-14]|uniref:Uncharacterized protein n=1 Tax=Colletotrichum gloeosporioides (strain Cg-14) TaxID=1237896 RepID=T0K471_COLGC|nr:hypothetical protein CGLO_14316 [Colletotrichum gloeosporioides Cg-14]